MTTSDTTTARACLASINPAMLEYDEWLAVGMAAKESGLSIEEWDRWSAADAKRYKPGEMRAKWASFRGASTHPVGVGSLVKLARDQGHDIAVVGTGDDTGCELAWDASIGPHDEPSERQALQVVRQEWLQDLPLPDMGAWDGRKDLADYLRALFNSDERVGIVTDSWEQDAPDGAKRWLPKRGVWDRTAGELLELIACAHDLGEVVGDWHSQAGAWIRFNPLDGNGCSDENVTAFRFALVESDDISVERQHAIYRKLELPIAALVHSGGKSLHAIVRIDAPTFAEYQKRVDFLYDVAKRNGLVIDRKNRNPSRLSRLPGATRAGKRQWLVATNIGRPTWADWADWMAAQNDDLPDLENLASHIDSLPPLADVLIDGVLRCGHKLLLTGPANAGKSFALLHLAVAIAEGRKWLGWACRKGRVLYVNLEVDRASCYHRLAAVYQALGCPHANAASIDVWNLRGRAQALDQLTPRLIRRAAKGGYAAVIIDPIYKVLTGDENAAHEMAKFCNQFDRMCREIGSAVIYCHHHSKGAQGAKYAADRASGSGVFKRDPDALLDLVELVVDDARRETLSQRWECAAMAAMLDRELPGWREDCPQDDAVVAKRLAGWAIERVGLEKVAAVRAPAATAAQFASGWRLECGTLREFPKFPPQRVWFRYPLHIADDGLLDDALADGEEPPRRGRKEAIAEQKEDLAAQTRNAIDACRDVDGMVSLASVAEYLSVKERAARDRIKECGFGTKGGFVVAKGGGEA